MPLVLKDGRIANVTVYTIPFETGKASLPPSEADALRRLVGPMATDCFLTAQAIGHVEPGVTRDGDTLSAHRLARARADNIQATLAGLGMPQAAVASVWDWQFLVEQSQVTLWVFNLTVGDECSGEPLEQVQATAVTAPSPAPAAEATAEPTRPARQAVAEPAETPVSPPSELRVGDAVAAPARQASTQASAEAPPVAARATPQVALADQTTEPAKRPAAESPSATTASAPRTPPASPSPADPLATAAVAPAQSQDMLVGNAPEAAASASSAAQPTELASVEPARSVSANDSSKPSLAVTFDVNSSFFPSGTSGELRAFLEALPAAGAVEIELAGAVGTGAVRGASDEEAQRYNAWMAERRIERVAEWLEANAGDRQLTLTPRLVDNDPSREVRLRAVVGP